ncbi:MAG: BamA/TamA family outer membrane protein [Candidatus Delongbacteria bacterium]
MSARWLPALLLACLAALAQEEPDESAGPAPGDWTEWRVRSLHCTGLMHTDSSVILRELELRPGVGYSDRLLQEDARAVKNTNLFARLVVSVNPDSSEEAVDIVYAVSERPSWLAYPILTPTDRLGWVYGFALMNRNQGGMGRRLDLQAEFGEHLSYSFYLQEPWFLGRRQPVSLYVNRRRSDSADGDYRKVNKEVRLGWQHYFDRETLLGVHPSWQEVTVHDRRPLAQPATSNPLGVDVFGGLGLVVERNTTDYHASPRTGSVQSAGLSAFGLGGSEMPAGLAAGLSLSRFQPLGDNLVLGLHSAADLLTGRRADYMKHYLGQRGRVRAGGVDQWPGWSLWHGSAELRMTLLPRQVFFQHVDFGLGAVAFLDGGLVWSDVFQGRRLAAGGAGVGLRLYAPFVEVGRVDLAWSPTHGAMIQIGQGHSF